MSGPKKQSYVLINNINIAVALTHLEDFDNARAAYERALQLDQKDPAIAVNYANLLFFHAQVQNESNPRVNVEDLVKLNLIQGPIFTG